jgi:para-nitrobenzyl esterase
LDTRSVAERKGLEFAKSMGAESLSALRAKSAEDIQRMANPTDFVASIDGWVLPDDVRTIFANGRQADVPVLVGGNADEGAASTPPTLTAEAFIEQSRRIFAPRLEEFLAIYPATSDEEARASSQTYFRDAMVGIQMRGWARAQIATGKSPAYVYLFERSAPDAESMRAYHGAEVAYAFNNVRRSARPFAVADEELSDRMAAYWVNFAATGNPNGNGLPVWPSYDAANERLLVFGDGVEVRPIPFTRAMNFLDAYFGQQER